MSRPVKSPTRKARSDGPHPFLRGSVWWARIPAKRPPAKQRSLGTSDRGRAKALCGMLRSFAQQQRWEVLAELAGGTLDLGEVFDRWSRDELSALQAERKAAANDPDLTTYLLGWVDRLTGEGHKTIGKYLVQLRTLMPEGEPFPRSRFRRAEIRTWLDRQRPKTRNRYRAAASSFAEYLLELEVLEVNPVRLVRAAPASAPRVRFLSVPEGAATLDALPEPHSALHALLLATGADVGATLQVRMRDVDEAKGEILIRGTKTHDRERTRRLLHPWAAERFWRYYRGRAKIGAALLFDLWDESDPRGLAKAKDRTLHALQAALSAVKVGDYATKDHRHTFAVHALKDGYSYGVVAYQLGHADTTLVHRVYGKYVPEAADYTRRTAVTALEPMRPASGAG